MTLLLFYIKSSAIEAIERQLEICITKAMQWTTKIVLQSWQINVAMHLCICNSTFCRNPVLILRSWDICDLTLTVHAHIQYLLERCHKSLNLIKVLSNTNWGPDTKTLLSVLRAQVRSK